jgi:glycosyltransferase A (GT-A) superfamily protein (DUF2064 family)
LFLSITILLARAVWIVDNGYVTVTNGSDCPLLIVHLLASCANVLPVCC